jgi:ABC-type transporter Mla MlaB component
LTDASTGVETVDSGVRSRGYRRLVRANGPGEVVVELLGEHGLETIPRLGEILDSLVRSNRLVVVDLSETKLVDSSVMFTLVSLRRVAANAGTTLRLRFGAGGALRADDAYPAAGAPEAG